MIAAVEKVFSYGLLQKRRPWEQDSGFLGFLKEIGTNKMKRMNACLQHHIHLEDACLQHCTYLQECILTVSYILRRIHTDSIIHT